MDGMLSQDEINALLSGMNLSDDGDESFGDTSEPSSSPAPQVINDSDYLSDVEKDAIGEVANISMGSSATTLYSLVNRKVNITTPVVSLATWDTLLTQYEKPCVFIQIKYTLGLDGTNILVLKEQDVKIITDLMMGGDGTATEGELGELHLSAISEAMNQMMGSAATSLSTMLSTTIDISPPESSLLDLTKIKDGKDVAPFLGGVFVKIAFRMQVDDLVDSTIMQLYPIDFARELVDTFISTQMGEGASLETVSEPEPTPAANAIPPQPAMDPSMMGMSGQPMGMDPSMMGMNSQSMGMDPSMMGMNPQGMGMNPQMMGMNPQMMGMNPQMMGMNPQMMGMNPQMMGMNPYGMGMAQQPTQNVNVQPAQFQSFAGGGNTVLGNENIGIIKDVPLEVTVELGRTVKPISEILDFAPGTVIDLERIAGEPIDVLINGKLVAKGEVVVIEESFAVRVTEIIK